MKVYDQKKMLKILICLATTTLYGPPIKKELKWTLIKFEQSKSTKESIFKNETPPQNPNNKVKTIKFKKTPKKKSKTHTFIINPKSMGASEKDLKSIQNIYQKLTEKKLNSEWNQAKKEFEKRKNAEKELEKNGNHLNNEWEHFTQKFEQKNKKN